VDTQSAAHEGIDAVVEIGQRNEHANAQHGSRHGIADAGKPEELLIFLPLCDR
jgi:hypothetical protein